MKGFNLSLTYVSMLSSYMTEVLPFTVPWQNFATSAVPRLVSEQFSPWRESLKCVSSCIVRRAIHDRTVFSKQNSACFSYLQMQVLRGMFFNSLPQWSIMRMGMLKLLDIFLRWLIFESCSFKELVLFYCLKFSS